jgi:hypothetical protein
LAGEWLAKSKHSRESDVSKEDKWFTLKMNKIVLGSRQNPTELKGWV